MLPEILPYMEYTRKKFCCWQRCSDSQPHSCVLVSPSWEHSNHAPLSRFLHPDRTLTIRFCGCLSRPSHVYLVSVLVLTRSTIPMTSKRQSLSPRLVCRCSVLIGQGEALFLGPCFDTISKSFQGIIRTKSKAFCHVEAVPRFVRPSAITSGVRRKVQAAVVLPRLEVFLVREGPLQRDD
jgi:hypothetical protein